MDREDIQRRVSDLSEAGEWNCFYRFPHGITTRTHHIDSPGYNLNKIVRLGPLLDQLDLRGKTILDVGCGDGYYAIECAKRGAQYVLGTDLDPLRIKRCHLAKDLFHLSNIDFRVVDLYQQETRRFDIVLALGLLHRVPDLEDCLSRISRMADILILEFKTLDGDAPTMIHGGGQTKSNEYNKLQFIPTLRFVTDFLEALGFGTQHIDRDLGHLEHKRTLLVSSRNALGLRPQPPERLDYRQRVEDLKQRGQGLMSREQYLAIAEALSERSPCQLLIFGLGEDSPLWQDINRGGTTVFLEDDADWTRKINDGSLEVFKVTYHTKVEDYASIGFEPERLRIRLPAQVENRLWDFVIVDGPLGHNPPRPFKGPGRMSSIYHAYELLRDGGLAVIDDMGRRVERLYAFHYFGEQNMIALIQNKLGLFIKR